jgi:nucleotidyltransferase/DNA polymerase involved in DNA repair
MLFYASVELDNPDLKGKPIALLVGQRIVVLQQLSYEARKFGFTH